jgi:beta-galactosidase
LMATRSVPYQAGTLKAVRYSGNKQVNISNLKTAAEPSVIHMVADRTKIQADVQDLSYVEVSLRINTDKNGCTIQKQRI